MSADGRGENKNSSLPVGSNERSAWATPWQSLKVVRYSLGAGRKQVQKRFSEALSDGLEEKG